MIKGSHDSLKVEKTRHLVHIHPGLGNLEHVRACGTGNSPDYQETYFMPQKSFHASSRLVA
ncbi:hypothetical protein C0Q70_02552 [Pomacea canaliculata]|uniref:Uncharacterized protein n=1 Tax=Pomacea canaliculata TaxID=400727 RepID=A0A2T7PQ91_POMCA|nr:hypothetical protein C0Q70_02552 [Pomacea canaliculata]